jgi:membrane associated rhomboid family serine protease
MYYELALISVLVAGGYWGWYFVRHDGTRLYGLLQLAAAALSGLGLLGRRLGDSSFGIPGAIGVGAGACLLLLGPLARSAARRFAGAERFGMAKHMLDVAEVLAPGSGVAEEKALLAAMREIRDGNIERTVEALTQAKRGATPDARIAIDERIAMLYLAAYRWDEAIAHAEEQLFGAVPAANEVGGATPIAIRRALGLAPPVWVELLGAYGYVGDLEQAARMLARLEDICAGRPDANLWLHRGRLVFLALAGRVAAVQKLVEPKSSRHMKPGARNYWVAVALERSGETAAAEAAYGKARSRTRGRPRVLIDQALARLPTVSAIELPPLASEVVARVEVEPPPAITERPQPRGPIATRAITVSLIAVSLVTSLLLGPTTDVGVLVREGALVRGLVHDGQWWRVVSANYIHIGGLHLLTNAVGVWMLGRIVEDMFGAWRTVAIYALAGIGGMLASLYAVPAGITAGASAALFGVLGAVFVELTWHRRRHRLAWSRGVWGAIAIVTVAQLGIGFVYPAMDQWAHGGGLVVGLLAGLVFSPNARWHTLGEHVARVVALAFIAVSIASAVLVVRTSVADSLAAQPSVRRALPGATVVLPPAWTGDQGLFVDADTSSQILVHRGPAELDVEAEKASAAKLGLTGVKPATEPVIPMPAGWSSVELIAKAEDALSTQPIRIVHASRRIADADVISATLYMPDTIARWAPGYFTAMLASIQPAP